MNSIISAISAAHREWKGCLPSQCSKECPHLAPPKRPSNELCLRYAKHLAIAAVTAMNAPRYSDDGGHVYAKLAVLTKPASNSAIAVQKMEDVGKSEVIWLPNDAIMIKLLETQNTMWTPAEIMMPTWLAKEKGFV